MGLYLCKYSMVSSLVFYEIPECANEYVFVFLIPSLWLFSFCFFVCIKLQCDDFCFILLLPHRILFVPSEKQRESES